MSEIIVESGKIYSKQELSMAQVDAEIAALEVTIADLTARKELLESKKAEVLGS